MEVFTFGERLMIYRNRAGLSKKELAERVGVSVATITNYEKGVSEPDLDTLVSIALALDVTMNTLLLGFGDPARNQYLEGMLKISDDKKTELQTKQLI